MFPHARARPPRLQPCVCARDRAMCGPGRPPPRRLAAGARGVLRARCAPENPLRLLFELRKRVPSALSGSQAARSAPRSPARGARVERRRPWALRRLVRGCVPAVACLVWISVLPGLVWIISKRSSHSVRPREAKGPRSDFSEPIWSKSPSVYYNSYFKHVASKAK